MKRSIALSLVPVALALPLATACPAPNDNPPTPATGFTCDGELCTVTGPILEDVTFTADKQWLLKGGVFVGDDSDPAASPATLTIEPGTRIFGDTSALSFLLITRGSKIVADGSVDQPIVFTSAKDPGQRARSDWGGIIINGQAPVNGCSGDPCTLLGEAGTGTYGGSDASDDSGVLRYVRVEFGGALIDDENELNGFAFQGVGNGTVVDHLQAHMMSDDCIEFFGGTVNAKHVVCTGIGDDNIDWTFGWTGKLQFVVAQQHEDTGGNGIEADNNETNNELTPVSHPTISNITLVGRAGSENSKIGVLLRRGTEADLSNIVVTGFNERCFDVDDAATFDNITSGGINIRNSIFDCAALTDDAAEDPLVLSEFLIDDQGNTVGEPGLVDVADVAAPDFRATPGSAAASGGETPNDPFFESVDFRGGCGPESSWMDGWTSFELN